MLSSINLERLHTTAAPSLARKGLLNSCTGATHVSAIPSCVKRRDEGTLDPTAILLTDQHFQCVEHSSLFDRRGAPPGRSHTFGYHSRSGCRWHSSNLLSRLRMAATTLAGCFPSAFERDADRQVQALVKDRQQTVLGYTPDSAVGAPTGPTARRPCV